ncbi:hypothetical protein QG37_06932 [Candidozyma auris]|uniref:Uncharacterized protein n=1 Tax=Candidozyma auris TaxID=498019 RepID=A0A0L0NRP7_CANAR|nr:hypothetical protein QG37_06932 [[Candida] auris]
MPYHRRNNPFRVGKISLENTRSSIIDFFVGYRIEVIESMHVSQILQRFDGCRQMNKKREKKRYISTIEDQEL